MRCARRLRPIFHRSRARGLSAQRRTLAAQEGDQPCIGVTPGRGEVLFVLSSQRRRPAMTTLHDPTVLPADIPAPQDDGAARHLTGTRLPSLPLAATDGSLVDLSKLDGRTVVYVYPRTGVPGQPLPDGWDQIPGARGCTPQ